MVSAEALPSTCPSHWLGGGFVGLLPWEFPGEPSPPRACPFLLAVQSPRLGLPGSWKLAVTPHPHLTPVAEVEVGWGLAPTPQPEDSLGNKKIPKRGSPSHSGLSCQGSSTFLFCICPSPSGDFPIDQVGERHSWSLGWKSNCVGTSQSPGGVFSGLPDRKGVRALEFGGTKS